MEKNSCNIFFMAHKKYSITFTETTHRLVCSLEKYGHNVRDIINAGIVLFDESDNPTRARAHMRAYSNIPEEVQELEKRLAAAIAERDRIIVQPATDKDKLEALARSRRSITVDDEAFAERIVVEALANEARHRKKKGGKAAKSA